MIRADVPPANPSMATRGADGWGDGGGDGDDDDDDGAMSGTAVASTSQYDPVMGDSLFLQITIHNSWIDTCECR